MPLSTVLLSPTTRPQFIRVLYHMCEPCARPDLLLCSFRTSTTVYYSVSSMHCLLCLYTYYKQPYYNRIVTSATSAGMVSSHYNHEIYIYLLIYLILGAFSGCGRDRDTLPLCRQCHNSIPAAHPQARLPTPRRLRRAPFTRI